MSLFPRSNAYHAFQIRLSQMLVSGRSRYPDGLHVPTHMYRFPGPTGVIAHSVAWSSSKTSATAASLMDEAAFSQYVKAYVPFSVRLTRH